MTSAFIYLASQSPRRRQLLEQIGVRHELLLADAAEDAESLESELFDELPHHYVVRVTRLKLDAAVARLMRRGLQPGSILCADTTVALDGRIYGKPNDAEHAAQMLSNLAGRTHQVMTAVAVACPQAGASENGQPAWKVSSQLSTSNVTFSAMDERAIQRYVASGEPMGKAGAYAVQGLAGLHIERIEGSYTGIMGLPLFETAGLLRQAGVILD